jgi:hypothetical protein
MADLITGLTCPNCSGILEVREGQRIVKCPYCNASSLVVGESGIPRYQVARRVEREGAAKAVRGFWSGLNKAADLGQKAQITELFLAYLPYWRARSQVVGWIFGEKRIRTKNSTRYEPREAQIMEDMEWSGAAGDVAEFGVRSINLQGAQFAAYDPEALHAEGMVFEPTGSLTEAHEAARVGWSGIDRISQTILHFLREALSLVYYPLWVARYTYRNRAYQVVVDGFNGRVLYGKAPGNIFFRALMLVGGTALGSFVMVDGLALALALIGNSSDDDSGWLVVLPFVAGGALIAAGYRLFRWGEEIEHKEQTRL